MTDSSALIAWAAVGGVAVTFLGVVVAVVALLSESRRSRFALGIDLLIRLDADFWSDRMCEARCTAAKSLSDPSIPPAHQDNADAILDFFEMLGLLVRRGALDKQAVWHMFFYWVHRYYLASLGRIQEMQKTDSTIWAEVSRLYLTLAKIEMKERHCSFSQLQLGQDEIVQFLQDEYDQFSDEGVSDPAS